MSVSIIKSNRQSLKVALPEIKVIRQVGECFSTLRTVDRGCMNVIHLETWTFFPDALIFSAYVKLWF